MIVFCTSMIAIAWIDSAIADHRPGHDPDIDVVQPVFHPGRVAAKRGWTVTLDNDALTPRQSDRDYTGGLHVSIYGSRKRRATRWGFRALEKLDGAIGKRFAGETSELSESAVFRAGLLAFTPDDIDTDEPIYNDRPYANLAYVEFSNFSLDQYRQVIDHTSLTVGLLGTRLAESVQSAIHRISNNRRPKGYRHQVSDGGEPTIRYVRGRYRALSDRAWHDVTLGYQVGIGYTTDVSVGLDVRAGRRESPWWMSVSDFSDMADRPSPAYRSVRSASGEFYVSGGVGLRFQIYNAFLQGQLRDSEVTLSASSLNRVLVEAWFGVTQEIGKLRIQYKLRYRSPQIKDGPNSRGQMWGALTLSQDF